MHEKYSGARVVIDVVLYLLWRVFICAASFKLFIQEDALYIIQTLIL